MANRSQLEETLHRITPRALRRVMDLVAEAGIDVSSWGSPSNPKYCYNWSFTSPAGPVVLSLWHAQFEVDDDHILLRLNMREVGVGLGRNNNRAGEKRAINMDVALQSAFTKQLPIRVILCAGSIRGLDKSPLEASEVTARELDTASWSIEEYDWESGDCVLIRSDVSEAEEDNSQDLVESTPREADISLNGTNATSSWSNEELRAAVRVYLEMLEKSQRGEVFSKTQYYLELSQQFGRTPKAFEYRMQNISYVLSLAGRQWLNGLKPAKNVGGGVAAEIEKIIFELEDQRFLPIAAFETEVRENLDSGDIVPPPGVSHPKKSDITITRIERDPEVKTWILKNAGDVCECCSNAAPFLTAEGLPFLEVHHLKRLADQGSDRISNAVAVCPNCHRELHFGVNSAALLNRLYLKVSRLVPE